MDSVSLINGICVALKAYFPDTNVYFDKIRQGMRKPCFFIYEYDASHRRALGNRYKRQHNFVVRYFIVDDNYTQLRMVADGLTDVLESIWFEGSVLGGINMRYNIDDDVLHFFFDINVDVARVMPGNVKMNELEANEYVRE